MGDLVDRDSDATVADLRKAFVDYPAESVRRAKSPVAPTRTADLANRPLLGLHIQRSTEELREFTRNLLPEYMVPDPIIVMDSLPLNANGKVDRSVLPSPRGHFTAQANSFVPPANQLEKAIAQMIGEMLHVDRVGRHASIFDMGGHSLLVTQLLHRLRAELGLDISLASLVAHPTPAAIAASGSDAAEAVSHSARIRADASLPAGHSSTPSAYLTPDPRRVFITGATGFLGAFLLHEIHHQISRHVLFAPRRWTRREKSAWVRLSCAIGFGTSGLGTASTLSKATSQAPALGCHAPLGTTWLPGLMRSTTAALT